MELSIVLVNHRCWEVLEASLTSLVASGLAEREWEVIVVDNASGDGRGAKFRERFPGVQLLESERNLGFAGACNLGAAAARGDELLFLNPDVIARVDAVAALQAELREHPEFGILTARQVSPAGRRMKAFDVFPERVWFLGWLRGLLRRIAPERFRDSRAAFDELVECDWVSGSVLLLRRATFEQLGGWCEDFFLYSEDADLCRRIRALGLRVGCTPRAEMIHAHGASTRRDEATATMARTETVISKHVYVLRHATGARRVLLHALIAATRLGGLAPAALLDLLTLRQVASLRRGAESFRALAAYYRGAWRRRTWTSPRVLALRAKRF